MSETRSGSIIFRQSGAKARAYVFAHAKWRDSTGRQHNIRLGRADPKFVIRDESGRWQWVPRTRGRAANGFLDRRGAERELDRLMTEAEAAVDLAKTNQQATFAELAAGYLDYAEHSRRVKPSTLRDYRRLLEAPRPRKHGAGENVARIMRAFGDRQATKINAADIEGFLRQLDRDGLSARNVNVHRQLLSSVFDYASRADALALQSNPVAGTKKRPEAHAKPLETFTAEEVLAIARAARDGAHVRNGGRRWASKEEDAEQAQMNVQDAVLYTVAGFTGLRQGELRALRWRNVRFADRAVLVDAGMSAGVDSTTKSGKWRAVPLSREAFVALDELSRREMFTGPEDYVFCGPAGQPLSSSALYRRFVKARDAAVAPQLPFHHLRHTFATLTIRVLDPASVQAMMGHSKITTTERYLHARPLSELAERLDIAFGSATVEDRRPAAA